MMDLEPIPCGSVKKYQRTRTLYIIEAALEYFINLMLSGAYIAKVANTIGLSDGIVGIIASMTGLGATFQLFALFLTNKHPVKRWITVSHSINQLLFSMVWLVPVFNLPKTLKIVLFITFMLAGQIINNVINSPKISWYMSMVDDRKRGSFTSVKEMFSLVGGMAFTLIMGTVIDRLEEIGNIRMAFLVGGISMLCLTVSHTVILLFSYERPTRATQATESVWLSVKKLFYNQKFLLVLAFTTICRIGESVAFPFFGTYQNNELGFSLTFISVIGIFHVAVRCVAAFFLGKYADKTSFVDMLNVSYVAALIGYAIMTVATPENGKLTYCLFYIVFYAIFQAGYGNGMMNLIYDSVDRSQRMSAYALYNAISGLIGFAVVILCSMLVSYIQQRGNTIIGMNMYAQQFLSLINVFVIVMILVILNLTVRKK